MDTNKLLPCPLKEVHDVLIENAVTFEELIKMLGPHLEGNDILAILKEQFQKSKAAAFIIHNARAGETK